MINRDLLLNKVSDVIDVYKTHLRNNTSLITNPHEQVRLDNAYSSLHYFTKFVFDVLESKTKRRFLTYDEISSLERFIDYFDEHSDVGSTRLSNAMVLPHSEFIYKEAVYLAEEIDIIKPIVRAFYPQGSSSVMNYKDINEISALISKIEKSQNSINIKSAMLDAELEKASQIIGTATSKLEDITKYQEAIISVGGKYQSTLAKIDLESESLAQKKNDLVAAHELLGNVRETYESNDKSLKEFNKDLLRLGASVFKMETRAATLEEELDLKTKGIDLIMEQANAALETSTTMSVGGFFKDQYDIAKKWVLIWPALAFLFLGGAIWICFDTLKDMNPGEPKVGAELPYLIARFCIVPLFLWGTWFCTNQYIKQKNITEDYAYKKVLSLSLIGFKSEIEKTGEANTTGFIKSLLKEILRSPLETLDKKHYKRETKLLKLAHDEMIANMFKNVTSKKNEPDEDKK
ncbi:hypothetical protein [Serratia fonticola]|uniref:hypothetical protein n=1 Tax=Serratia fonticola TaxID=47917 RepID=UPI002176FB2E|nr:hypothetical protein [Serratia fonticola]CAI1011474.1 Uncharacterised protein [Serratia fonticola]